MRRRLNTKFLLCLLGSTSLLAVGTYFLHGYQAQRHAGALLERAEQSEKQGNLIQAVGFLDRYLSYRPGDTDALARYGLLLIKSGDPRVRGNLKTWDRAYSVLEKVLRQDADRHDIRRKLVTLAMDLRRFEEARVHLTDLLKAFPGDGELEQYLGQCYEGDKLYKKAAQAYLQSIYHAPQRVESYALLAHLVRRQPEAAELKNLALPEEVAAALGRSPAGTSLEILPWSAGLRLTSPGDRVINALVARNGSSFRAFLARADYRQRFQAGDPAPDIARARGLAPRDAEVLLKSAEAAGDRKDFEQARAFLEQGIRYHPRDPRLYRALAQAERRAGRPEQEIQVLRRALKDLPRTPNTPDLIWGLADALVQAGKGDEADREIRRLKNAGYPAARLEFLDALKRVQKQQWLEAANALQSLNQRLVAWPELRLRANLLLAQSLEQVGDPERQLEVCRRVVFLDPSWAPGRLLLGSTLLAQGKSDQAATEFRRLLALPGAPRNGWQMLARALLAVPAAQRNWAEVDEALRQAAAAEPNSLDVVLLRVQALAMRKQFAQALALLDQAKGRKALARRVELWAAQAQLTAQAQGRGKGLEVLEQAARQLGDSTELRLARAWFWARNPGPGAKQELTRLARDIGKVSPADQARLLAGFGKAFYQLGDYPEAQRLWTRLAGQQPKNLQVRLRLMDVALQTSDLAALQRVVPEIRALEGEQGIFWRYGEASALTLRAEGRDREKLREARRLLNEVADRRPNWSRVAVLQGLIHEQEGMKDLAVKDYRQAVSLGNRQPEVFRRLVQLLNAQGRYLEANEVIQQLPEQALLAGDFRYLAVDLALRLHNPDQALDWMRQAVPPDSKKYQDHIWFGVVLEAAGQPDKAEESFRRAVRLADRVPETWVALVQFLARSGGPDRLKEAEAVLRQAEGKLAQHPLALAQCYQAIGRQEAAEKYYRAALAAQPKDRRVRRAVAAFYLTVNQFDKAEPHLIFLGGDPSPAAAGDRAWARRMKAVVAASRGNSQAFDSALKLLDQNIETQDGTVEDLRLKAFLLALRPDRRQEAVPLFEHLVRLRPVVAQDRFTLAQLYEAQGSWYKAREQMEFLLTEQGKKPEYLAFFVGGLLRHNELDKARSLLAALEEVDRDSLRTLVLRVRLLQARGKAREAAEAVRAYSRRPDANLAGAAELFEALGQTGAAEEMYRKHASRSKQPEAVLVLARFLARQKDPRRLEEALDLCDRAWATCPPDAVAFAVSVVFNSGRGSADQYRRAEGRLRAALRKSPDSQAIRLSLGQVCSLQGRTEEAMAFFREVLKRNPNNVLALNNLAWLLALKAGGGEEAVKLINQAIALAGPLPSLLDTRAVVAMAMGQREAALKDLTQSIERKPAPGAYFHLARLHWLAKDRQAAREAWQKAQKAGLTAASLDPLELPAFEQMTVAMK